MMLFPLTRVKEFVPPTKHLRYGQAFHQFMRLDKCEQDRAFCDRLYEADGEQAKAMIEARTDKDN